MWKCWPCEAGGNAWKLAAFLAGENPSDKPRVMGWLREQGLLNRRVAAGNEGGSRLRSKARTGLPTLHSRLALSLWHESEPAGGTVVEKYLASRGLTGPIPATLRFLPRCLHKPSGIHHPAMIAAVTCWPSRKIVAVHRTFLHPEGEGKATVKPPRMALGSITGAAIRLARAGEHLAVAEGIETALTVQQEIRTSTWAALSAGGIRSLILPELPLANHVVIAVDPDSTGLSAAYTAAERWSSEGRRVSIAKPPAGLDFNDLLKSEASQ